MASLNRVLELGVPTRQITIRCEARGQKTKRSEHPNVRANILLRRLPKVRSLPIDWHDQQYTFAPAFLENRHCCLEEVEFLVEKTSLKMKMKMKTKMKTKNMGHRMHFFIVPRVQVGCFSYYLELSLKIENLSGSESIANPGVLRLLGAT